MKTRILGNKLEVSAIGLGCMGMSFGYDPLPENHATTLLPRDTYQHTGSPAKIHETFIGNRDSRRLTIFEYFGKKDEMPAAGQSLEFVSSEILNDGIVRLQYKFHHH